MSKDSLRLGLVRSEFDAHTLGLTAIAELLGDCGVFISIADARVRKALSPEGGEEGIGAFRSWIHGEGLNAIGFSYRLDPEDGLALFARLLEILARLRLMKGEGGPIGPLFFAGLPETCRIAKSRFPRISGFFLGDETPGECLETLGLSPTLLPASEASALAYDESRLAFGKALVSSGRYLEVRPPDRSGYKEFGSEGDRLVSRIRYAASRNLPPLMRAHLGPYLPNRAEAVELFLDWSHTLAEGGLLDILSIGTSQLTQSRFGEDWGGEPNGGGVPLASPGEFIAVKKAAQPMLVRCYAGTKNIVELAKMYERTIDIAWHALSLWWFCRIDGRGENSVLENLREHFAAMDYIASTEKPFEPNVPHHFAFRGSDDVSYVASGYLAAKAAKARGIRNLVLQVMLQTPKLTRGTRDLAKARALLRMVRGLEGGNFRVHLQPRGGLNSFSPDERKAKAQLAAVTAMMNDIEPGNPGSPRMIHVVSYCEATRLADPAAVNESVKITREALSEYRKMRTSRGIIDPDAESGLEEETEVLFRKARSVVEAIEKTITRPYSPEGFYAALSSGFFPLPALAYCREEFAEAVRWQTRMVRGAVEVVDDEGKPIRIEDRIGAAVETAKKRKLPPA